MYIYSIILDFTYKTRVSIDIDHLPYLSIASIAFPKLDIIAVVGATMVIIDTIICI